MDINGNFFELFQLPLRLTLDHVALTDRYRELQKQAHPDRFAAADDQQRRLSVQFAAHINDAYTTLKNPLKRADYLLQTLGYGVNLENNSMDPAFLMQQMEWRERLDSLLEQDEPLDALDDFADELQRLYADDYQQLSSAVEQENWAKAQESLKQLHFIDKLQAQVNGHIESFD